MAKKGKHARKPQGVRYLKHDGDLYVEVQGQLMIEMCKVGRYVMGIWQGKPRKNGTMPYKVLRARVIDYGVVVQITMGGAIIETVAKLTDVPYPDCMFAVPRYVVLRASKTQEGPAKQVYVPIEEVVKVAKEKGYV